MAADIQVEKADPVSLEVRSGGEDAGTWWRRGRGGVFKHGDQPEYGKMGRGGGCRRWRPGRRAREGWRRDCSARAGGRRRARRAAVTAARRGGVRSHGRAAAPARRRGGKSAALGFVSATVDEEVTATLTSCADPRQRQLLHLVTASVR
uniref:Uncharacterized protein n=1 Tax=Arundo donax TaxID=35708 RepID=A0A0A9H604_ARUDO